METLIAEWGLWGLFVSAFLSSTLLPGGSEVMLAGLVLHETHSLPALFLAATAGNTLGGISSWLIGWLIARRWPAQALVKPQQQRALMWLQHHGSPVLLLSWLPLIGDPLCLVAGWLGFGFTASALFIALGKAARYAVILALLS